MTREAAASAPDSDLTARAREVLAGLSEPMRKAVWFASKWSDQAIGLPYRDRTLRALCRRDVAQRRPGQLAVLTDLGRECARLLSEGGASDGCRHERSETPAHGNGSFCLDCGETLG